MLWRLRCFLSRLREGGLPTKDAADWGEGSELVEECCGRGGCGRELLFLGG